MNIRSALIHVFLICLMTGASLAAEQSTVVVTSSPGIAEDMAYQATVLVRNFDAPGMDPATGILAADSVVAHLEKSGLVHAVRPTYRSVREYNLSGQIDVNNAIPRDPDTGPASVGFYGAPVATDVTKEVSIPASDYILTGSVSWIGNTWWISASVSDRLGGQRLAAGSATGEGDKGIFTASRKVVAELESAWAGKVFERRVEAIYREVSLGSITREIALDRLIEMNRRRPGQLAPVAGIVLLLKDASKELQPDLHEAAPQKLAELLPAYGPDGKRFLLRIGLDPNDFLPPEPEVPPVN